MKPGLLKKWWSYITDVHIESMSSPYNESIHVLLSKGRYQLCTPNAIYSYADKYTNFRGVFERLNMGSPPLETVLILGFGLGSIPYMLEKVFKKEMIYTGVEIDETVIYLASKYVLGELVSDIELIHSDARTFMVQNTTKYDIICVDVFVDDQIPRVFCEKEFLDLAQASLSTHGILLFNHLGLTTRDISKARKYFDEVFVKVFKDGTMLQVEGNVMMISDKKRIS